MQTTYFVSFHCKYNRALKYIQVLPKQWRFHFRKTMLTPYPEKDTLIPNKYAHPKSSVDISCKPLPQPVEHFTHWPLGNRVVVFHYCDVIMNTIASQITSLTIVYLTVNSGTDQRKHQSSTSLAFVRGIHRRPVNFPHKGPVTRKMFPFDDVIML